jgi:hypothetical protein
VDILDEFRKIVGEVLKRLQELGLQSEITVRVMVEDKTAEGTAEVLQKLKRMPTRSWTCYIKLRWYALHSPFTEIGR